ncbi:MAG: SpoVR family protein [Thermodesulfobacteriota bacterium]
MELIDQHTKQIMEGCKERAREMGLNFEQQTLEYIVSNRDLLELSPKLMIPTLYDYWVQDVEVLKEKGRYDLYPVNPFETVINTRPAISFYNDNNPDWMNVMIFYHVLAHIDFFQNNYYYQDTWNYDFKGEALADKRLIARLRSEKGRWVDYIIEFARGIDNLVGYFNELSRQDRPWIKTSQQKQVDYYFDVFLQSYKEFSTQEYLNEIEEYNSYIRKHGEEVGNQLFFSNVKKRFPEFEEKFKKYLESRDNSHQDLLQFIMENSDYLNRQDNKWIKSVIEVVRKTSVFFQPQIRTKIMNEGWATYWHETLFLNDDRIKGHEVDFAKTHSKVAALSRVGMNAYAIGSRIFKQIKEYGDKGKYSLDYLNLRDITDRKNFDMQTQNGRDLIFKVRKNFCDFMFIRDFVNQDFVNRYQLFVAGKKLNRAKRKWEYYVKSRKAEDYRQMLMNNLYHPPCISFSTTRDGKLYLKHHFEEKPLVQDYISNTMLGIEYLWGAPVQLETHEVESLSESTSDDSQPRVTWKKVLYTMENKRLSKQIL